MHIICLQHRQATAARQKKNIYMETDNRTNEKFD
jgi:hypothetical protein